MAGNNHLLQKVTFEIGLASQEGAFEIQNRISNAFQSGVIAELEKLFDRYIAADKVVTIEKIEINLGDLNSSRLEEEFVAAIEKEMEQFLAVLREEIKHHDPSSPNTQRVNIRLPQQSNPHFEVEVVVTHEHVSHFEKVIHLLEFGVLPVSSSAREQTRLSELIAHVLSEEPERLVAFLRKRAAHKQILQRLVLNLTEPQLQYIAALLDCPFSYELPEMISTFTTYCHEQQITPGDFVMHGHSFSSGDPVKLMWFRILLFYASAQNGNNAAASEKTSGKIGLLVKLVLAEPTVLKKLLTPPRIITVKGKRKASPALIVETLQAIRWELKIETPSARSSITTEEPRKKKPAKKEPVSPDEEIREDIVAKHDPGSPKTNNDISAEEESQSRTDSVAKKELPPSKTKNRISSEEESQSPTDMAAKKDLPSSKTNDRISSEEEETRPTTVAKKGVQVPKTDSPLPLPAYVNTTQAEDPPEAETGIYVRNAGLIILHPYLKTLFGNLDLLEGKEFKNPEAAWKAVHMLQHACGFLPEEGQEGWSEHDLVLNKLLCGLDISEPVPETLPLSDQEKNETIELLQAILNNWTILQRSSVHALQSTFLQKQGRLKKTGTDWDLLIERDSAVEILIDKLPWGISMVKLPWNNFMILTQW